MRRDELDTDPARGDGQGLAALLAALVLLAGCSATPMDFLGGGETLMSQYRTPAHEVDYKAVGLTPPPMGLRWYRVDKTYVLANRTTGLIIKSTPIPQPASAPRTPVASAFGTP